MDTKTKSSADQSTVSGIMEVSDLEQETFESFTVFQTGAEGAMNPNEATSTSTDLVSRGGEIERSLLLSD